MQKKWFLKLNIFGYAEFNINNILSERNRENSTENMPTFLSFLIPVD